MQHHATAMSLADFLISVADKESANGKDMNADIFRQRAAQAMTMSAANQYLIEENETLTVRIAEAQRVMRGV